MQSYPKLEEVTKLSQLLTVPCSVPVMRLDFGLSDLQWLSSRGRTFFLIFLFNLLKIFFCLSR